jgi:protein tyrosine phosphatase (PTP) superfamily phosphohydrolase (DUF442 family)
MPSLRDALHFQPQPPPTLTNEAADLLQRALSLFDPSVLPHCSGHFVG